MRVYTDVCICPVSGEHVVYSRLALKFWITLAQCGAIRKIGQADSEAIDLGFSLGMLRMSCSLSKAVLKDVLSSRITLEL